MMTGWEPGLAGWNKRLHAWMLSKPNARYERAVAQHKQRLLGALSGDVLEIGPGGGTNLAFYSAAVRWTGVEPNPYIHAYLKQKAEKLGREFSLRQGSAESLEVEDSTFDAVVSTLVLCSVRDPFAALSEILRVLKPGGRFVFIEHVAAPAASRTRRIQRWIRPLWKILGDGCNPERETWVSIERAGFDKVDFQHFRVPFPVIGPHIAGLATKRAG
ncbi:MAG: class I SAM-dependent methyltransferase [Acidobacteriia bacterium]|nr:class I SAM-dependent methyltransferase [Terriglobia bacterium]